MLELTSMQADRQMSIDDSQIDYSSSSTNWRSKYIEVADMLAETRAELDDFHHASKELEAELENELQRTEKAQQELKVKIARAESEREDWKTRFMSLQTNHNTTTTSLQRELDTLRQEHQHLKVQLRDLEMGNDDLERNERAVSSSLADMEAKYSRALEEKILLEHELLEKATLEEESQRLRDELRDAMVEISILKDQLEISRYKSPSPEGSSDAHLSHFPPIPLPSEDDLLTTPPPPNLQLDDLSPSMEGLLSSGTSSSREPAFAGLPASLQPVEKRASEARPVINSRSSTLPSLQSPSTTNSRISIVRSLAKQQPVSPRLAATASSTTSGTLSKNKGVQMVSEMRARVRNLEQKIHTRVPRLRMGSITGKSTNSPATSSTTGIPGISSSSSSSSRGSTAKTSWESLAQRRSGDSRRSNDGGLEKKQKESRGDSSGWVLILEDSPSPPKDKGRERRSISSPSRGSSAPRSATVTSIVSPSSSYGKHDSLHQSVASQGVRRPQSRLSAGSLNTATSSSIPTPISRPATPTYLPLPSGSMLAYGSDGGISGYKRSTGPNNSYCQQKRSSLGSGSPHEDPTHMPPPSRPATSTPLSGLKYGVDTTRALPQLPSLHSNITIRPQNKLSASNNGTSVLGRSRIGRPSGSGRKSTDNIHTSLKSTSTQAA